MASKLVRFLGEITGIDPFFRRVRHHRVRIENELRSHSFEAAVAQLHCSDRIHQASNGPFGQIALVTAMPPSDTGIAYFSLRMAKENPSMLDIFTEYREITSYYDQITENSDVHIFPASLLSVADKHARYKAIVFSFGNSWHNLFVLKRLHSFSRLGISTKICVEIHDPCLLNIAYKVFGDRIHDVYKKAYGDRLNGANISKEPDLIERGVFGIKALLDGACVDEIIVHSRRAREMVLEDYGEHRPPVIKVGFHPVFENLVTHVNSHILKFPSVGSFGVPGAGKYLREKLEAFTRLKRENYVQEAIFAGYQAHEEIKRVYGSVPEGITVVTDPSDVELAKLMSSVTVAVQLRRKNLGESSGVIPQLLGYRKAVICNSIGAFAEYGDAVSYLSGDVTADTIYSALLQTLERPQAGLEAIDRYVSSHRSNELLELIAA